MRFLRKIMGVTRLDRVRNTVIRETLGVEPLLLSVEKAQLRWYGHVLRMARDRMARAIFTAQYPMDDARLADLASGGRMK